MIFPLSKKNNPLTDDELIEKYKYSHDSTYVGELFKRYTHLVTILSLKYLKNPHDSEDAVMEVFEIILADLKRHEVKNFKAWVYSVTKNHCLKRIRKAQQSNHKEQDYLKTDGKFVESVFETDLTVTDLKETQLNHLEQGIQELSEAQKRCIELFYFQNKSYKEVAEITEFSLKEVKSYLQNGKRNLRLFITRQE